VPHGAGDGVEYAVEIGIHRAVGKTQNAEIILLKTSRSSRIASQALR
jgi:hypothetical protein